VADVELPAKSLALARYKDLVSTHPETLITGSDDHTLFLWPDQAASSFSSSATPKKPLARLTGHQKQVNHVAFSPDGRWIASAGFDNAVKIWEGRTGKFVASLRGHVAAVYRVAWSADSRMLVSASKDSTLKVGLRCAVWVGQHRQNKGRRADLGSSVVVVGPADIQDQDRSPGPYR
jgi:ribosome assembly protein 4